MMSHAYGSFTMLCLLQILTRFNQIRMDAAEYFYLKLQSADTLVNDSSDELETIILETEW